MKKSKSSPPKQTENVFEPEYMVQDGIKHEFTGLLFIPAPGEAEKIETRERENRPTPELTRDSSIDYTTVIAPFPRQWTTQRVKMSGMDMLRLRSKGQ